MAHDGRASPANPALVLFARRLTCRSTTNHTSAKRLHSEGQRPASTHVPDKSQCQPITVIIAIAAITTMGAISSAHAGQRPSLPAASTKHTELCTLCPMVGAFGLHCPRMSAMGVHSLGISPQPPTHCVQSSTPC
jgi:hypothetical protein